jgi:zinc transport system substrate-binding protein
MPLPRCALPFAVLGAGSLLVSGCAPADTAAGAARSTEAVQVLASFYPLQYVAERVGGDAVDVASLTPPGTEPHDVELSPRQVRAVGEADLVLYLSGFQSAVDEAVEAREPAHVLDAADAAELVDGGDHAEEEHAAGEEHADADDHAAEEADAAPAEEEHADVDPHFWLDPQRLAALAGPVAEALSEIDPDHATAFADAAADLEAELGDLHTAYASGLASCERRVVVTAHEAFGYLTRAYDLEQVGISGLDPEAEPSPARLREIGDVVRAEGVTTIFTETLVDPEVAETLAADLGVTTAVLDPVESLTEPDSDYRAVMEANLVALREGLGCS